ncbi:MAG TPA: SelB C-terminal domain-containing protein, partial [Bacillota bacterium]
LHTGTSEVLGRCLLLDRDELEPGQRGFMLFRAESDVVVAPGDRYIIRSYSPMHTIGGGVVLDAGRRYRRLRPETLAALKVLERGDATEIAVFALRRAGAPVPVRQLATELNLPAPRLERALAAPLERGEVVSLAGGTVLLHQAVLSELVAKAAGLLDAFHRKAPLKAGMSREELRKELVPGIEAKAFTELLERLAAAGALEASGELVRRPGFQPQLDERLQQALPQIEAAYADAGMTPPTVAELCSSLGLEPTEARALFDILGERRRLVRVSDDLYFHATAYEQLVSAVCARIAAAGPQTVAEIRDLLGTSRKYVLPLLEHLDQCQITRRVGDRRELTPRGQELAQGAGAGGATSSRSS